MEKPEFSPSTVNHPADIRWTWSDFGDLSGRCVHDLLQLRQSVFILEQQCLYPDIDGDDLVARHLIGTDSSGLVAACRIFRSAERFPIPSIGRVLTAGTHRGKGLGHELIRRAVLECRRREPDCAIRIAAQAHLSGFYGAHGFIRVSEDYPVDEIPHCDLELPSASADA